MSQFLPALRLLQDTTVDAAIPTVFIVFIVALAVLMVASMWIIFERGGEPGWAAIIPIYNQVVLAKVAGKEWWWGLLVLIPVVGFFVWVYLCIELAEQYGHGAGFGIGLALLSFIFFPILAFSGDQPLHNRPLGGE